MDDDDLFKRLAKSTSLLQRIILLVKEKTPTVVLAWVAIGAVFYLYSDEKSPIRAFLGKILGALSALAVAAEQLPAAASPVPVKTYIVGGMMIIVTLFFAWSLITLSVSKSAQAIGVAQEAVKTLSGFFIGAITGFLG